AGVVIPVSLLIATVTQFDTRAFREPTLTGALTRAPDIVGPIEEVGDRFQAYRRQLDAIGRTTFRIYRFLEEQSVVPENAIRVLHISDLHLNPVGYDVSLQVARQFNVDLVVDTGDLTAQGTEVEAGFADRIHEFKVPYLFVRGNHDSDATVAAVGRQPNAQVLDGELVVVESLSFYGVSDPLFTPGRSEALGNREQQQAKVQHGEQLKDAVVRLAPPPDVVLIHDRAATGGLIGMVPLILSGHGHRWFSRNRDETLSLGVGSTGGAGLESLTPTPDNPLSLEVLYFDLGTRKLVAYDRIEIRGPQQEFRLTRTVLEPDEEKVEAQETSSS
ncbi:MAG: metallophosphoesterase family protein, partial [Acidimicrobiia bacterium]